MEGKRGVVRGLGGEEERWRGERVGRREEMSWYMGGVIDLVTGAVLHLMS